MCTKIFLNRNGEHLPQIFSRNKYSLLSYPTVCDDDCTGVLLRDLDQLDQMALSVNLSGPLHPPYKMLYSFENTTQELKVYSVTRRPEHI